MKIWGKGNPGRERERETVEDSEFSKSHRSKWNNRGSAKWQDEHHQCQTSGIFYAHSSLFYFSLLSDPLCLINVRCCSRWHVRSAADSAPPRLNHQMAPFTAREENFFTWEIWGVRNREAAAAFKEPDLILNCSLLWLRSLIKGLKMVNKNNRNAN